MSLRPLFLFSQIFEPVLGILAHCERLQYLVDCSGISLELWSLQSCSDDTLIHKRWIGITVLVLILSDDITQEHVIHALQNGQHGKQSLLPFVI